MEMKKISKKKRNRLFLAGTMLVMCLGILGLVAGKISREVYLQNLKEEKLRELQKAEGLYSEDSIVLNDTTKEQAELLADKLGGKLRMTGDGTYAVIYLPQGMTLEEVYNSEEYGSFLEELSLDYYVNTSAMDANNHELFPTKPDYAVSDEGYTNQNYLDYINLKDSWNVSKGQGVTVAVIDTGIDTDHEEFAGKISDASYNASTDKRVSEYGLEVIEDENGHGTEVAGVIAATMNNAAGIAGIAPDTELIVIKCECDAAGQFVRGSDLMFGLAYAIECDADVINMSFGTPENLFEKYTKLAVDSDIICIAAAGNEGIGVPTYPAADENVIGVGAFETADWSLTDYSNYGDNSDILAPGTVYTTTIDGNYKNATGTSMSTPIVTAAVAMYLAGNPHTEYGEMFELLQASSVDVGTLGEDWYYGYGLLDIYALICEEKGTITYEMLTDEVENQTQVFVKGHTVQQMPEPERENVVFDGWYYDIECTDECEYYTNTFTSDVTLYAKWINEDEGSAYLYTILDDGTVEIQSYTGKRRYLTVPSVIEGRTVSSIGADAFAENGRIRSITLPPTITNIGERAFYYCTSLRGMDIPENVAEIGAYAFSGCVRLNNIGLAANGALTTIGYEAFSQCGMMQIAIPAKVKSLGNRVFFGCTSLRKVLVEDENTHYKIMDNALYDASGTTLLYYPSAMGGEYVVNENTTEIADAAFAYGRVTKVTLPESLNTIADEGFMASALRSIQIPASVSILGRNVFASCSSLSEVQFSENSQCTQFSVGLFSGCGQLQQITIPASVQQMEDSVFAYSGIKEITFAERSKLETIGESAFTYCPLQNVTIPEKVISIGRAAFAYCNELNSIKFDGNSQCENIGREAFTYCQKLQTVELPDTLKTVENQAFYESGLTNIEIGEGLIEIGEGAFAACHDLESFVVAEENTVFASYDDVLFTDGRTELVLYPGAREGVYQLPEETTLIRGYAFASTEGLTEIHFNSGLKEIGEYAFSGCVSMVTPNLPAQLETIGANAFEYCSSMTDKLVLPKSVINVGRFAFYNDYDLTEIRIEAESEMSRIGYGAFAYCGIIDFTIPGSVTTMGQEVFTGCKNLLTITYEADSRLENLAAWTFEGADELRQITFEEGSALTLIEARACQGLDKLEKVDLTHCTKLTKIGNYAFNYCKSLHNIALPASVTEIGRYAFNGCASLMKTDIPKSVDVIGRYAFAGTGNMEVFFKASVLPAGLEENWDYDVAGYYMGVSEVVTSGDWTYALTDENKASVISYNGTETDIILEQLDGHEVVSIGGRAFYNNTSLQSIVLPESLSGIYQAAFAGTTSLTSITIPANVTVIDNEAFKGSGIETVSFAEGSKLSSLGRYAFADTAHLTAFTLPDGVTKIKDYAFYNSKLSQITFGADAALTEIGRYAFAKSAIQSVVLPEKLEKIDYYAFSETDSLNTVQIGTGAELQIFGNAFYRSGLASVVIPGNVSYIGELCFTGCESLTSIEVAENNANYSSVDGVLFDKEAKKLITCPAGKTGSYEVNNTVIALAFSAFEDSKLSEVIIPEDSRLNTIGYRAFANCKNLTGIHIPAGVQSIENYAFAGDENLENVTVAENSQLGGIYRNAFYNCAKLSRFEIPAGVQEIAEYAFYGCTAMSDVQLAENSQLKGVYDHAFEYSGITAFVMPENLQEVGAYAFRGAKIATLVCNKTITEIGDYAFADCGLADTTVLTIPETVEYLGKSALQGATALEELSLPFLSGTLDDLFGLSYMDSKWDFPLHTVHVLGGSVVPNLFFENWRCLKTVSLSDSITSIGPWAFYRTGLETIELPDQLREIKEGAFKESNLQSIVLPDTVENIGAESFMDCVQLQSIVFSDALTSIGAQAFKSTAISNVELLAKLIEIGAGAFSDCKNLEMIVVEADNENYTSVDGILYDKAKTKIIVVPAKLTGKVVVPEGVTLIGDYAFSGVNISEISLPDTLKEIGIGAFSHAKQLEKISIPDNVTTIGRDCFANNENLKEAVIGSGIQKIDKQLFFQCVSLENVILPEGITQIDVNAFADCFELENITIPQTVTSIGDNAFLSCTNLKVINIPESVEHIGEGTFTNCMKLCRVNVDVKNKYYSSVDGMLFDKAHTTLLFVPSNVSGEIIIPEGVEIIASSVFSDCTNITSIVLPDSLKKIGDTCFAGCLALQDISLGNNIEQIGGDAFWCTGYWQNESNWENGVLYLGKYLLEVREDVSSLTVKPGTTLIAEGAATYNVQLERVILPDSVKYINGHAFAYCENIKAFRNSDNLKRIDINAFAGVKNLKSITIPDSLSEYESSVINTCKNINYIKMEAVLPVELYDSFFYDCPGVEWIYIPRYQGCLWHLFDNGNIKGVIISGDKEEYLDGPYYNGNTEVFCNLLEAEVQTNRGDNIYYKGEWNLSTFYVDGMIVQMKALKLGELVQEPSNSVVADYLPEGAVLIGWDINGDGSVDKLPDTLTEEMEAHAVYDVPITGISTEEAMELEVGRTKTLTTTYIPQECTHSKEVTWESSDESIAVVDETGKVTAIAEGTAVITATLIEDTTIQTTCTVTVIPIQYGIKLDADFGEMNVGEMEELSVEFVLPEDDTDTTIWTSTDETIATVNEGSITALGPGNTTISMVHGSYIAYYYLTVKAPLKGISLDFTEAALKVGETKPLEVSYDPVNTTDSKEVLWYSEDISVVRVDAEGLITAVGPGTTNVIGVLGNMEVSCKVTVSAPLEWIVLNTTTGTMRIDRTKPLEVIYQPSNTTDDKAVTWTSSDDEVASVDETGIVMAHKAGTAVITATVGEHTATYTVTVVGIKDKDTGIIITNSDDTSMDENISMDVEEVDHETMGRDYKTAWERFLEFLRELYETAAGHREMTTVFDISLLQENVTIQPDKTVDVEIPVPEEMSPEDVVIYRMEEDGTITDMHAEYVEGRFRFRTNHFSVYAVGAKSKTVYVDDIELSEEVVTLCTNHSITLTAKTAPETAENANIIWTSADEMIATVDSNGVITALAEGTVEITATAEDGGGASKVCKVVVAHDWTEASCSEAKTCKVCGTTEGESLGHDWTEATCSEAKTCKVCGTTEGEALGHSWSEASCSEAKTCKVCGTTEGEALGHSWKDATCTVAKTCKVCGVIEGEALGHSWNEATCTVAKNCKVCGVIEGEALGHDWMEDASNETKTCKICGVIEGLPHVHDWSEATCSEAKTCKVCGVTEGEALGHDWTEATCTTAKICKVCGTTEGESLSHDWSDATCTVAKTCKVCGATEGEALGHIYELTIEAATTEKDGMLKNACSGCDLQETTVISKIASVELEGIRYEYTGNSIQPAVVVKDSQGELITNEHYSVTYSGDGVNAGNYTVEVAFKGDYYSGTSTLSYEITALDLKTCAKVVLGKSSYTYNGKAQKPSLVVKNKAGALLKEKTDYSVTYKNNKNIGKATVTITGKGNYSGKISKTFTISAKKGTTFKSGAYKYKITDGSTVAFAGINSTKTTKVTIAKTVKYGGKTFKVTSITDKALYKKTNVTKVTIGANVTAIGKSAFEGCTKLSSVTIGSNVTKIGDQAFKNCTTLKKVTIPSKVKTIGKETFSGCKKLKTITVKSANLTSVGKNAFKNIESKATIKVPKNKLEAYLKLMKNKGQGKNVQIKK